MWISTDGLDSSWLYPFSFPLVETDFQVLFKCMNLRVSELICLEKLNWHFFCLNIVVQSTTLMYKFPFFLINIPLKNCEIV